MDAVAESSYQKLLTNLEDMTKLYRQLLELVRREKDVFMQSDLTALNENNTTKDSLLMKLRLTETLRLKHAQELSKALGLQSEAPRLLELAKHVLPEQGDRLRSIHSALEILVSRITELNRENEEYALSALNTLNGAMNDIKETLSGKKTYARKGQYKLGPDQSGNFVSKEA